MVPNPGAVAASMWCSPLAPSGGVQTTLEPAPDLEKRKGAQSSSPAPPPLNEPDAAVTNHPAEDDTGMMYEPPASAVGAAPEPPSL